MIYLSTGGFSDQPAWMTSEQLAKIGLNCFELSGGQPDEGQFQQLNRLKKTLNFQLHNYFPPPSEPFIFNLASLDPLISSRSFEHVLTSMQWALELDRPTYSFHAGFLLDPQVKELGKNISNRTLFDREKALDNFLEKINRLSEHAHSLGVALLIENNVLSAKNYHNFSGNPFLMATAEESAYIMRETPNNVNLLVDVAHLKVSAQTLNFDPVAFLNICDDWIKAYHLSDNDGTRDSNDPITNESWFWPHMKSGLDYYSLEVYNASPSQLFQQLQLVKNKVDKTNENYR
ncbi:sugar phosphate isomerase/epimerase family protein [Vreelandella boliviensis]|uniref:sugar phosphate isomerase/epimerase family protein n=1 Tax=Vreelandella boliviensis TaxID=223527 RepID=UPI001B8AF385|nr:sugar phosphate isomerase/epimerase family protein [Halomonas boliviensis]MBS3667310.1 sugar phosphate isomerase/epimerase [Halomonas boliviensis]